MRPLHTVCALSLLTLVAACSSIPLRESDQETLARYLDYAGEPVDQFNYLGRIDGWRPLDRHRLVVFSGVNDAYLLTVFPTCPDLRFETGIALVSRGVGHTITRGDIVRVGRDRCRITEIRPVDYRELRQAEREMRQAGKEGEK